jgi:hypothetical protein
VSAKRFNRELPPVLDATRPPSIASRCSRFNVELDDGRRVNER